MAEYRKKKQVEKLNAENTKASEMTIEEKVLEQEKNIKENELLNEKIKEKNKKYQHAYRIENKETIAIQKAAWYKSKRFDKYGITKQQFDIALESQQYKCAICLNLFSDKNRVYVDHCHDTGKVRGLLCFHCNTGLGQFRDNVDLLQKGVEYLNDNPFSYS